MNHSQLDECLALIRRGLITGTACSDHNFTYLNILMEKYSRGLLIELRDFLVDGSHCNHPEWKAYRDEVNVLLESL